MSLFHILMHCMSLPSTLGNDFLPLLAVVEKIERRSMYCRSIVTSCGPAPQILLKKGLVDAQEFDFLLRFPVEPCRSSPVSFLSPHAWGAVKVRSVLSPCLM